MLKRNPKIVDLYSLFIINNINKFHNLLLRLIKGEKYIIEDK